MAALKRTLPGRGCDLARLNTGLSYTLEAMKKHKEGKEKHKGKGKKC